MADLDDFFSEIAAVTETAPLESTEELGGEGGEGDEHAGKKRKIDSQTASVPVVRAAASVTISSKPVLNPQAVSAPAYREEASVFELSEEAIAAAKMYTNKTVPGLPSSSYPSSSSSRT